MPIIHVATLSQYVREVGFVLITTFQPMRPVQTTRLSVDSDDLTIIKIIPMIKGQSRVSADSALTQQVLFLFKISQIQDQLHGIGTLAQ